MSEECGGRSEHNNPSMFRGSVSLGFAALLGLAGCDRGGAGPALGGGAPLATESASPAAPADENAACQARFDAVSELERAPGAPAFDADRAGFLGRARSEPIVFVREPAATAIDALTPVARAAREAFDRQPPGIRVMKLKERLKHDKAALRSVVLREGYVYFDTPLDAFYAAERLTLTDLFDDATIVLARGAEASRLRRVENKRDVSYVHDDGPYAGRPARLLFGDRVGPASIDAPLHRDVASLTESIGYERVRFLHLTEGDATAALRVGGRWIKAVLSPVGSTFEVACLAEPRAVRDEVEATLARGQATRAAQASMRAAVTELVFEALPFDRPRGVEGPDRDGELRPHWMSAYLRGSTAFEVDGETYPVYRPDGRAFPPAVCVDFVLDTFERAGGSWFRGLGDKPGRTAGRIDFSGYAIENRRGVLGFGKFVEERPDVFRMHKIPTPERIPFADRAGFFDYLVQNADLFAPGDVLAIQGLKRDDRVHQHAILLERVDPITGFPYGLADQMKVPRRRTWEGIMAEAPKRSLLYRARPDASLLLKMTEAGADG